MSPVLHRGTTDLRGGTSCSPSCQLRSFKDNSVLHFVPKLDEIHVGAGPLQEGVRHGTGRQVPSSERSSSGARCGGPGAREALAASAKGIVHEVRRTRTSRTSESGIPIGHLSTRRTCGSFFISERRSFARHLRGMARRDEARAALAMEHLHRAKGIAGAEPKRTILLADVFVPMRSSDCWLASCILSRGDLPAGCRGRWWASHEKG
jgi:hypothetical protein